MYLSRLGWKAPAALRLVEILVPTDQVDDVREVLEEAQLGGPWHTSFGDGQGSLAYGAGMLLATNLICVNLVGVVTFLLQGARPLSWWETDRAKRSTCIARAIWITLLAALAGLMVIAW